MGRVIALQPEFSAADLPELQRLPDVSLYNLRACGDTVRIPDEITGEVTDLLIDQVPVNIGNAGKLSFVQLGSSGFDHVVGLGLTRRGIRIANGAGNFDVPIAEWVIAMMINLARDVPGMLRNQQQKLWERPAIFQNEIRGGTLGIWGYGGFARETARLAKALGMKVQVHVRGMIKTRHHNYRVPGTGDPDGILPDRVFTSEQRLEFLQSLDYLLIAMPLTDATRGIVGNVELKALPDKAFVLNPARGPIIQEQALLTALRKRWIAGAALDTHYHYPLPPDHPLWTMPNVILTPHISGSGMGPYFRTRLLDIFTQNIRRLINGSPLLNELIPDDVDPLQ